MGLRVNPGPFGPGSQTHLRNRDARLRSIRGKLWTVLGVVAIAPLGALAAHYHPSTGGSNPIQVPPASSPEGGHTTAPTHAPPTEAPKTTKPPETTSPSPTPKETGGGQGSGGQAGPTTTECEVKPSSLECTNNGGNPNPIEVTVTDTGDDLSFSTGKESWHHSKRQDTSSRPLKTPDGACTVIVETIPVGKFRGALTCDRPQTAAYLQPNESDTRDILARANANLRRNDSGVILVAKDNGAQQSPTTEWLAVAAVGTGAVRRRKRSGEGVRHAVELGCHAASVYAADAQREADLRNPRYAGERNFLPAHARR